MTTLEKMTENLDASGDIPQSRFGHTITVVSNHKVVLFGGAIGDIGKYSMTGDTYIFNVPKRCWIKLNVQGTAPSPRAAHASTAVEAMQMVVYGGATGGIFSFTISRWKFGFRRPIFIGLKARR